MVLAKAVCVCEAFGHFWRLFYCKPAESSHHLLRAIACRRCVHLLLCNMQQRSMQRIFCWTCWRRSWKSQPLLSSQRSFLLCLVSRSQRKSLLCPESLSQQCQVSVNESTDIIWRCYCHCCIYASCKSYARVSWLPLLPPLTTINFLGFYHTNLIDFQPLLPPCYLPPWHYDLFVVSPWGIWRFKPLFVTANSGQECWSLLAWRWHAPYLPSWFSSQRAYPFWTHYSVIYFAGIASLRYRVQCMQCQLMSSVHSVLFFLWTLCNCRVSQFLWMLSLTTSPNCTCQECFTKCNWLSCNR